MKKTKGQGALTPAQIKQLQFNRTLLRLKITWFIEGYDSNLLAVLCTFCIFSFLYCVPLIWFERNFKKTKPLIGSLTVFFLKRTLIKLQIHDIRCFYALFKWTGKAMAVRTSAFVKFVVRSVNKSQVWNSIQLIICHLASKQIGVLIRKVMVICFLYHNPKARSQS